MTDTRTISDIIVGERFRKDFGDLSTLVRSIDEIGLQQPIAITPDNRLIAGGRRLRAWQMTRFRDAPIPVHVIDLDQIVKGEYAENSERKPFTPSEIVAINERIAELYGTPVGKPAGEISATCANKAKGKTTNKTAAFAGVSARQIEKAKAVVDAARQDPEKFGALVEQMDRTGKVNGPYKRLKVQKQVQSIKDEPPGLPNRGPYRCIVADMPWPAEPSDDNPAERGRAYFPYPTMSIKQMCEIGAAVRDIAHGDCWLWFWVTNFHLLQGCAHEVLKAWGFEPITMRTWAKNKLGHGQTLRGQTEHVILAKRGNPVINLTNQTTLLYGDVLEHSQKPARFYADVETLCPSTRYAELFSRRTLPENWDGHGDQVGMLPADERIADDAQAAVSRETPTIVLATIESACCARDHQPEQPIVLAPACATCGGSCKPTFCPNDPALEIPKFLRRNAEATA